MRINTRTALILIPALILFGLLCWQLQFTQDDAYISYRYVANFLNGHGLVFNIGERVEGYTNFGWVILLSFLGGLGLDFILLSKLLGALFGAGYLVLAYLLAERLFARDSIWYLILPISLVAANGALAYWSPAGLETAAFAFVSLLAVYCYLSGSWLLIAAILWAVLLRPDGVVLAVLLILGESISERKFPRFSFLAGLIAFILALPFVAFKFAYYGSLLPNPFYAKTGANVDQLSNGLEYTWLFFKHYGFVGIAAIVCLVRFSHLSKPAQVVLVLLLGFLLYITLIGGDVLKVHRFFLPLFALNALVAALAVHLLIGRLEIKTQQLLLIVIALPLAFLTWWIPRQCVSDYNANEKAFVHRMGALARDIRESDSTDFSVATPTVGVFGYELLNHPVIDMLGLTDSTIARYSEPVIPGMQSTWKESKHNSAYLLNRAPDYIVFSTGIKPSAPAERALVLYDEFSQAYRAVVWFYQDPVYSGKGMLDLAYKRMHPVGTPSTPSLPAEYAEALKQGLDAGSDNEQEDAIRYLGEAKRIAESKGGVKFTELLWSLGLAYLANGQPELGVSTLNEALAIDSMTFGPHRELYTLAVLTGDERSAALHRAWLTRLIPWYLPRLDALTAQRLERARQTGQH